MSTLTSFDQLVACCCLAVFYYCACSMEWTAPLVGSVVTDVKFVGLGLTETDKTFVHLLSGGTYRVLCTCMLPVRVFNSSAISSQQFFFRCINNNSSSSFFGSFRKHVDVDEHLNFPKCIVLLFLLLFLATHCRHTHRRER